MAPPSTSALTAPLGVGGASGATLGNQSKRKKVALAPGCSPLDWARLKSTTDLRVSQPSMTPAAAVPPIDTCLPFFPSAPALYRAASPPCKE